MGSQSSWCPINRCDERRIMPVATSIVRVKCSECGDIELDPREFEAARPVDGELGVVRFVCPTCSIPHFVFVSGKTVDVLVVMGALRVETGSKKHRTPSDVATAIADCTHSCGSVRLHISEIRLYSEKDGGQLRMVFACPVCNERVERSCSGQMAGILVARGATLQTEGEKWQPSEQAAANAETSSSQQVMSKSGFVPLIIKGCILFAVLAAGWLLSRLRNLVLSSCSWRPVWRCRPGICRRSSVKTM